MQVCESFYSCRECGKHYNTYSIRVGTDHLYLCNECIETLQNMLIIVCSR